MTALRGGSQSFEHHFKSLLKTKTLMAINHFKKIAFNRNIQIMEVTFSLKIYL